MVPQGLGGGRFESEDRRTSVNQVSIDATMDSEGPTVAFPYFGRHLYHPGLRSLFFVQVDRELGPPTCASSPPPCTK